MIKQIEPHQAEIQALCLLHNIKYLGVFGSYARGHQTAESDIDLLVEFSKKRQKLSIMDFIDLQEQLSQILQKNVDLVRAISIKPEIAVTVLEDIETIYPPSDS